VEFMKGAFMKSNSEKEPGVLKGDLRAEAEGGERRAED
jgi:hypothetical protein